MFGGDLEGFKGLVHPKRLIFSLSLSLSAASVNSGHFSVIFKFSNLPTEHRFLPKHTRHLTPHKRNKVFTQALLMKSVGSRILLWDTPCCSELYTSISKAHLVTQKLSKWRIAVAFWVREKYDKFNCAFERTDPSICHHDLLIGLLVLPTMTWHCKGATHVNTMASVGALHLPNIWGKQLSYFHSF